MNAIKDFEMRKKIYELMRQKNVEKILRVVLFIQYKFCILTDFTS